MPIFQVTRTDAPDYDEFDGVIVRAVSADKARAMVLETQGNACIPKYPGFYESNIEVELITSNGPARVISTSFNAG